MSADTQGVMGVLRVPLRRKEMRWQWWASDCSRHFFHDPRCDLCQSGAWVDADAGMVATLDAALRSPTPTGTAQSVGEDTRDEMRPAFTLAPQEYRCAVLHPDHGWRCGMWRGHDGEHQVVKCFAWRAVGDDADTRVRGVVFILTDGERVLMEQCPKKAARHGAEWSIPGGRIEAGETCEQALRREMFEELRCEPLEVRPLPLVDASGGPEWPSFLMQPYLVTEWRGFPPDFTADHPDVPLRWFALSEAQHLALSPSPAVREVIQHALDSLRAVLRSPAAGGTAQPVGDDDDLWQAAIVEEVGADAWNRIVFRINELRLLLPVPLSPDERTPDGSA